MRRRPRLKVVGHSLNGEPCNLALFNSRGSAGVMFQVVEIFTPDQWDRMHPAERPEDYSVVAGIGDVTHTYVTEDEWDELREMKFERTEAWKAQRAEGCKRGGR